MGPPSSGGIAIVQILGMLQHFPSSQLQPKTLSEAHLFTQASRLAYADRAKYVGDTAFVQVPIAGLLNQDYIASRAKLLQEFATFYLFGCEESYGYLANDLVRDKDGNSACLMLAEVCAHVKSRGLTVPEYLDEIYLRTGYYLEGVINLYYEGASGAEKIKRILSTYRDSPPKAFGDVTVTKFEDFGRQDIVDGDGELVPKQDLYLVTLANGYTFAARGSGTEPKMKFYVFAKAPVKDAAELPAVKAAVKAELDRVKALIEADAKARAEG